MHYHGKRPNPVHRRLIREHKRNPDEYYITRETRTSFTVRHVISRREMTIEYQPLRKRIAAFVLAAAVVAVIALAYLVSSEIGILCAAGFALLAGVNVSA